MSFKVASFILLTFFLTACSSNSKPKPKQPDAQVIGVEVVEEVVDAQPVVVAERVAVEQKPKKVAVSPKKTSTTTPKKATPVKNVTKKETPKPKPKPTPRVSTAKQTPTKKSTPVKNSTPKVTKKSTSSKSSKSSSSSKKRVKRKPVKKAKKPVVLKPEPFSIERNEEDPELLGPQTTLDNPLLGGEE
ncbi:MAG: hypothetical protein GXN91_04485 [Epsilonproteobacteria bacterium]|nr:hypothetical protein [Campylobacterota bacterium]